ncbi:MAG: DNA polymerase I [Hyphomicrobiales bacterium]|nr:DNA polymerase I [Hyphomicrobiales bacterium]
MSKINSNSTLFLIDGSTFIFRAYFAMLSASQKRGNNFTKADGTPTGAVMAFCNMMWKIINKGIDNIHPSHMAVIFDTKEKTFRNDIYPLYKANRDAPPEDLIPQFPIIHRAVEAFNIKSLSVIGYEADDLIATYSKIATMNGAKTFIISGDKDLMQLINDNVKMYDPMPGRERFIDKEGVHEKFGVYPEKVVDVQALAGDSTDNIPGVPGIGIKIAAELINEYGSLENLLTNAENIKQNKRRENLINFSDKARLSYKLALLDTSSPIVANIDDLENIPMNYDKIISFSKEMELTNLINRIDDSFSKRSDINPTPKVPSIDHSSEKALPDSSIYKTEKVKKDIEAIHSIESIEQIKELIREVNACESVCFDIEIDDDKVNKILLTQNGIDIHSIEIKHDNDSKVSHQKILEELRKILEDPTINKIFYDYKDYLPLFYKQKIHVQSFDDLSLMSYVINNGKIKHDLNSLFIAYQDRLNITLPTNNNLAGEKENNIEDIERVGIIYKLWNILKSELSNKGSIQIYEIIEKPLISTLFEMERNGIKIDVTILKELSQKFNSRIEKLEKEIQSISGLEFNIASPKQLGEVLFDILKLAGAKKTKSGSWATGIEILEDLSLMGHEIADKIIEWRQLSKLKSTYTDSLPNFINQITGRIHTRFSQALTSTGRLSSSNPNLQNIPIRTNEGKLIRSAFIPDKDNSFLSADYSQIELRVLSHVAKIDQLQNAFQDNLDIHKITASTIFNVPTNEVTETHRYRAKAINFGIIYGISAYGLSKQLRITRKDAQQFIVDYFDRFPGIKEYMNKTIESAKINKYVTTVFGRRCFFPEINSKNHPVRSFNERAAINAPIQGSAADIIKRAMIKIFQKMNDENLKSKMILQIHDELIFEVPHDEIQKMEKIIIENMENATVPLINFSVPLKVDIKLSKSWG